MELDLWQLRIKAIGSRSFLLATIVVLVVYIVILWWLPKDVFWSPDEGAKFLNMHTISWDDSLRFTIPYNGRRLDPGFQFYPSKYPTGHVYPQPSSTCNIRFSWSLWFPLLSLIPYRLFGMWGLYLLPLLCGWGTAVLSGFIARHIQPKAAVGTVLVVGLATPILFYSVLFWEHTLAIFLGLFAVWLFVDWPQRTVKWPSFLGIGVTLLLGTALRLETSVFAGSLFLALLLTLWPWRKSINTLFWLKQELFDYKWHYLVSSILLASVAWLLFVARPPQKNTPASYCKINRHVGEMAINSISRIVKYGDTPSPSSINGFRNRNNWNNFPRLFNLLLLSEEIHPPAWLLGIGIVGVVSIYMGIFVKKRYQFLSWIIGITLVAFFVTFILFSEERYRFVRSIFLPAPYLLLVIYFDWRKQIYSRRVVAFTILIYLLFGIAATIWRERPDVLAGPEWGSRYMLHFYPVAVIGTVVMLVERYEKMTNKRDVDSQIMIGGTLLLIGLSILFNARGLHELSVSKTDLQAYQVALSNANIPVVSDLFWLPAALAPYYLHNEMYILDDPSDMQTWIEVAAPQVKQFYYVSFSPPPSLPPSSDYDLDIQSDQAVHGLNVIEFEIISHQ